MKHFLAIVLTSSCLALSDQGSLSAATYLEPTNGKVLFRADQLPIDVDTINWLSSQLVVVASTQKLDSAAQLRAKAQLLAISSQLNKDNSAAKKLNRELRSGQHFEIANNDDVSKAKARIWSIVRFLSEKNAGEEANLLATRIKDALRVVDSKHPSLGSHVEDSKAWLNVVPPIEKYKHEKATGPDKPNDKPRITDEPDDDHNPPKDEHEDKEKEKQSVDPKWSEAQASIKIELEGYVEIENKRNNFRTLSYLNFDIKPEASARSQESNINFETAGRLAERDGEKRLEKSIQSILKTSWNDIDGAKISLRFAKIEGKFKDSPTLTNGIATVLNGVLAGKKIRSNLYIMGGMNRNGTYHQTDAHWPTIRDLRKDTNLSSRILVPEAAEADFRQYIALENPEFFVKNEIIGVKNLKDSLNYVGIEDEGKILSATMKFKEFQKVAGSRSVGPLMTNKHVRAKLEEIVAIMPNHISAKTLLLQGTANRTTKLEPLFLAYELEAGISGMRWLTNKKGDEILNLDAKHIDEIAEKLETRLDEIQPYVDSSQKGLMDESRKIAFELKNLARARARERDESDYHKRLAKKSYIEAVVTYRSLNKKLAAITKRETSSDQ